MLDYANDKWHTIGMVYNGEWQTMENDKWQTVGEW